MVPFSTPGPLHAPFEDRQDVGLTFANGVVWGDWVMFSHHIDHCAGAEEALGHLRLDGVFHVQTWNVADIMPSSLTFSPDQIPPVGLRPPGVGPPSAQNSKSGKEITTSGGLMEW